ALSRTDARRLLQVEVASWTVDSHNSLLNDLTSARSGDVRTSGHGQSASESGAGGHVGREVVVGWRSRWLRARVRFTCRRLPGSGGGCAGSNPAGGTHRDLALKAPIDDDRCPERGATTVVAQGLSLGRSEDRLHSARPGGLLQLGR